MSADFLDTNVFVYVFDDRDQRKKALARMAVREALDAGAVISYQVVQETLHAITKRLPAPVTPEDARDFLSAVLVPLWRVMPSERLLSRGLDLMQRYQLAFYDSLIVAAALEAGCSRLVTEDLHSGQRIESVTVVNPFAS